MILRARRLLEENPDPSEEEVRFGLAGNLCRCTGYQNIVKAFWLSPNIRRKNRGNTMSEESKPQLQGIGASRRRVEDARFIQGKGNYVDDIKLPGMLFGAFVRSPHAHARVKSIRAEAAVASPASRRF